MKVQEQAWVDAVSQKTSVRKHDSGYLMTLLCYKNEGRGTGWNRFMEISPYRNEDAVAWDEMVAHCPMATFLHTRRFLAYHLDRFRDVSLLLRKKNRIITYS